MAGSPRRFSWPSLLQNLGNRGSPRHAAARAELIHRIENRMRFHLYEVGVFDRNEQTQLIDLALDRFAEQPGLAKMELAATTEEVHAKVSNVFFHLIDVCRASPPTVASIELSVSDSHWTSRCAEFIGSILRKIMGG